MSEDVQGQTTDEASESSESSEATIAVHWREEGYIPPPPKFIGQANASDPAILDRFAEENFPECFREYADLLHWDEYWHTTLDTSNPPFWKWFVGGKLNASYNCVDRHLAGDRNKAALIWVPEPEDEADAVITYQELYRRVNEFAAVLQDLGVQAGDRVTLHMPMVPELPVTMLACARLGVVHSQVFAGFSGGACGGRIADSGSKILITMDGYYRSGDLLDHKVKADEAVEAARKEGQEVDKVLVWRRFPGQYSAKTPMVEGRDVFVDDLLADHKGAVVEPVSMPAEAPLFLMYTSGTTGRPKGCQHSTGGYLSYVAGTSKFYQDIHPDDTYWCMADIGWITGHSYIVYGPLALGTTTVLYEGTPNYPDAGRPWRVAERLGVNIFHTSPTAIRMLRKVGPDEPAKYNYHFKHMTTVGEPIEPEAWRWYYEVVGKGEAVIVDTWWQTETGAIMISPLPGVTEAKPGSAMQPLPGISATIVDEEGNELVPGADEAEHVTGYLVLDQPWPSMLRGIWGDPERYKETYWSRYADKGWYFAGDGARVDSDGSVWLLGRIDDVMNVSGHRISTTEVESALVGHSGVAEAAVVGASDETTGQGICAFVILESHAKDNDNMVDELREQVAKEIGKIARPREIHVVPELPKTRSGKIMRRLLRDVAEGRELGDTSTLVDPSVFEAIRASK